MKIDRLLVSAGALVIAGLSSASELSGVVTGPNGPEAGVWVIAETADLPTKFARIVVTDEQGRYLVPDLPKASYEVWVRGYGLADSPKVKASPGERLDLSAMPRVAAEKQLVLDEDEGVNSLAQWTAEIDKVAMSERPQGVARNLVVTTWDWSVPHRALQELVATDRRNARINANGRLYGLAGDRAGVVPILDPRTHSSSTMVHPVRDAGMFDEKGRVWFTVQAAPAANPEFCRSGSKHPSAKAFPLEAEASRHLSVFEPKKGDWKLIRTCFPTGQLHFGFDDDNTVWTSAGDGAPVLGWVNRRVYEQTRDEARAQGWTPFVLDTSGDGKRGAYVEPHEPVAPNKDKRIAVNLQSLAVSPLDNAVWGTVPGHPGGIVRVAPGRDPARNALAEYYEIPAPYYGPRGGDVDTNGVFWVSLASGHLGRFVRASCKVLKGPTATGQHCPEGWSFYDLPGAQLRDVKATAPGYATWVDWEGILGLGSNVPIVMDDGADALHVLVKGKFVTLHIPYAQGVFAKSVDGRIDDERAGWKGRGLWTTSAAGESDNDDRPKVVKLQLRPHPLAK